MTRICLCLGAETSGGGSCNTRLLTKSLNRQSFGGEKAKRMETVVLMPPLLLCNQGAYATPAEGTPFLQPCSVAAPLARNITVCLLWSLLGALCFHGVPPVGRTEPRRAFLKQRKLSLVCHLSLIAFKAFGSFLCTEIACAVTRESHV